MHRIISLLLITTFVPCVQADDAQAFLESLFGSRIKQVKASLDRADDLALAKEMLAAAETIDRPEGVAVICDAVIDLTQRHNEGLSIAIEAAELLGAKVDARRADARKKLTELLLRQATSSQAEARQSASERLITLHMQTGDEAYESSDYDAALGAYRQAMAMAQRSKSDQLEVTRARVHDANHRSRTTKQIARLEERLLANAKDSTVADELIRAYVIDLDSPGDAIKYLDRSQDAILKRIVPLAAKSPADRSAAEALSLGQWYADAAGQAAASSKTALRKRAATYLTQYLDSTSAQGLDKSTATLLLKNVNEALEQTQLALTPVPKPAPSPVRLQETWISKEASFKVSSQHPGMPPRAGLLTGGDELMMEQFAFHTDKNKTDNYVVIDLGKVMTVSRIWIENRRNIVLDRAVGMTLSLTTEQGEIEKPIWKAQAAEKEWTIKLDRPVKARYVNLRLKEESMGFHLAQVKVYGAE